MSIDLDWGDLDMSMMDLSSSSPHQPPAILKKDSTDSFSHSESDDSDALFSIPTNYHARRETKQPKQNRRSSWGDLEAVVDKFKEVSASTKPDLDSISESQPDEQKEGKLKKKSSKDSQRMDGSSRQAERLRKKISKKRSKKSTTASSQ